MARIKEVDYADYVEFAVESGNDSLVAALKAEAELLKGLLNDDSKMENSIKEMLATLSKDDKNG